MSAPTEPLSAAEPPAVLPDPDHSPWQELDPRFITLERLGNWIFSAVVAVGCLAGGIALYWFNRPAGPIIYGAIGGLLVLVVAGTWLGHVLPALAYRHTRYRLSKFGFEIQRGILWRTRITIPISRVQHTDVAQGPLQRKFGIGKLIVCTAGTQYASVELDGLGFDVASRLRDSLVTGRESLDGV